MLTPPRDTSATVEEMLLEVYRAMEPGEKLAKVVDLNRTVEAMATARIQARYGRDLSDRELRLRLAALALDRDTMRRVFAWDPEREGL